jgi:tetratricopeptide (TPR) repeat protein
MTERAQDGRPVCVVLLEGPVIGSRQEGTDGSFSQGWTMKTRIAIALVIGAASALAAHGADDLTEIQQLWVNSFNAEKKGTYDEAIAYNTAIIRKTGEYYYSYLRGGWLHYLKGDYTNAVSHYQRAAQLSPGAVSPLQGLVNCLVALDDPAGAAKVAKSVLLIDPMNYAANKRLAELHYGMKDYSTAAAYYLKLSSLYPEDLVIANSLAWCYLNQGLRRRATPVFRNVLAVSPDFLSARQGLELCEQQSETKENTGR